MDKLCLFCLRNPLKHLQRIRAFSAILEKSGFAVTVRRKLGSDINAACGQLRRKNREEEMPYIVIIFDEYTILQDSPLMKTILNLAQKGPRVGIHIIMSTSHPSVNVISNRIKTLFPTRIAFKTRSAVDSRTILDISGAEELLGYGDMLLLYKDGLTRLNGAFADTHQYI